MQTTTPEGAENHLRPAERLVPSFDWYESLIKVAARVAAALGVPDWEGYRHTAADMLRVLVHKTMTRLSTGEAADDLNDKLYDRRRDDRGRKPKGRRRLGGTYPRFERLAPNESQVNAFIRRLPTRVLEGLEEAVFRAQVEVALDHGLMSTTVDVYVDYTNAWYYGKDTFPTNPVITGVHNGPGTNKARKFCAVMLSSQGTSLFAGVFATQKGSSKAPTVAWAIARLRAWGLMVRRAEGDRGFSTYDLLAQLTQLGIPYLGAMKKTVPVKRTVDAFLYGRPGFVVPHLLHPHPGTNYKVGGVPAHLIFQTGSGRRLRDVVTAFHRGALTLVEARKQIHVFITTESPPQARRARVGWAVALAQAYRSRWRLESGFRDAGRVFPTSHARTNAAKQFNVALQMFAYNAWQLQRALHRQLRRVPKVWRRWPTLHRFGAVQARLYAAA